MESKTATQGFFGGVNVTALLPQKDFVVSIDLFGDPQPGVYKFLELQRGLQTVVVGEHDYVPNTDSGFPMCRNMAPLTRFLHGQKGLEIGGPSELMRGLGIYTDPAHLDNMHLFTAPGPYIVRDKTSSGNTFFGDAENMGFIKPESYDFVFSSHMLEHTVNPLQILKQMASVIKPGGHCVVVLPFKDLTFDHRRPTTDFQHLLQHYKNKSTEQDSIMDHVTPELLQQYDFTRDIPAGNPTQFFERCKLNPQNRLFHIHVFNFELLAQCFEFIGFNPVYFQLVGMNQIVVAQKH